MALRLLDKNKKLYRYQTTNNGAVITKGRRQLYILFKSVSAGKRAREVLSKNSFDILFKKGKKVRALGSNVAYLKF